MHDLLSHASNVAVQIFAIASMSAVGVRYTPREILGPLRNVRGVLLALLANFIAVPLLAFGLLQLLRLEPARGTALVLVACAAGAPVVIPLTAISGGNIAFSAGLLVLLVVASIAYMPLVVPHLIDATVSASAIAMPLVLTMLLPLVMGLLVDELWPTASNRVLPVLAAAANVALVGLVVALLLLHFRTVLDMLATSAVVASVFLLVGSFAIGWLFGAFGEHLDDEMAFATANRNFAAAMVVAAKSIRDPDVLMMVVVMSLLWLAVLFPAAKLMRTYLVRRSTAMT
jgi:BASS family bile acid:Na+ symporter